MIVHMDYHPNGLFSCGAELALADLNIPVADPRYCGHVRFVEPPRGPAN
jgi:hypothetical protein